MEGKNSGEGYTHKAISQFVCPRKKSGQEEAEVGEWGLKCKLSSMRFSYAGENVSFLVKEPCERRTVCTGSSS